VAGPAPSAALVAALHGLCAPSARACALISGAQLSPPPAPCLLATLRRRYLFKTRGAAGAKRLCGGLLRFEVVPGTRLLCTGFWGLSRHINYLGEILQAVALALPGSLLAESTYYQLLPWAYPLYYVCLFIPRQIDDDAQLVAKYGDTAFAEYAKRVPWRIVPRLW
jgi:hypothetical protein